MRILWLGVAASAGVLAAQDGWTALERLQPDQETRVETAAGLRRSGRFVSRSADAIVIRTRQGDATFGRADVVRVIARPVPRSRSATKGAIIGGAVGLAFAIASRGAPGAVPTFAGLGALAGASTNQMIPVYKKN